MTFRVDLARDFASRLSLMRDEAMRLGLLKTMQAFDRPTTTTVGGEPAGPLYVVGYEIAEQSEKEGARDER